MLAHLARCGPIRQHLLAERLGVTQMSLTGFLDRLEQVGLVARRGDPGDRRAKQAQLTEAADPVLVRIARDRAGDPRRRPRGDPDADWERSSAVALAARDNLAAARELRHAEVQP